MYASVNVSVIFECNSRPGTVIVFLRSLTRVAFSYSFPIRNLMAGVTRSCLVTRGFLVEQWRAIRLVNCFPRTSYDRPNFPAMLRSLARRYQPTPPRILEEPNERSRGKPCLDPRIFIRCDEDQSCETRVVYKAIA